MQSIIGLNSCIIFKARFIVLSLGDPSRRLYCWTGLFLRGLGGVRYQCKF